MEKLDDYRGYHPLEFVILQCNRYKNLEIYDLQRDREIAIFLYWYLFYYYLTDVIELKDLFLSNDKESQLLGLQMCCRDFIDTFNLIIEIDKYDYIINTIIIYIQQTLAKFR